MNTYNERMVQFTEDLINTFDEFLDEPEHLKTPADLEVFLKRREFGTQRVDATDLDAVKELRERLRGLWTTDDLPSARDDLNQLIEGLPLRVAYSTDGGVLESRMIAPDDAPLVDRIAVAAASGLQWAIATHGLDRMRACNASPCKDVFIDTSRNAARRFCSERCANRYNVAQFRARQRPSG